MKQNLREAEIRHSKRWAAILGPDSHSWFHLLVICKKPSKSTKILLLLLFAPLTWISWVDFFCNHKILSKTLSFYTELKDEPSNCVWFGGLGKGCQGLKVIVSFSVGGSSFQSVISCESDLTIIDIFFCPTFHPHQGKHSNHCQPSSFTEFYVFTFTSFWKT